jgi:ribosome-associated protein
MREVSIRDEAIRLGQLLKLANLVSSGADVKSLLASEEVRVNGAIEIRRGRTLHLGDQVVVGETSVTVVRREPFSEAL